MADTISAANDTVEDTVADTAKETMEETAKDTKDTLKQILKEKVGSEAEWRSRLGTLEDVDKRLRRELEARVRYFAQRPEEIDGRLEELDREWDMERLLMANAGALSLMGVTFGVVHRRWHLLTAAMGVFLVQHATQGWCLPSSLFRRLGIRTAQEINHEIYALKALRGDFKDIKAGEENPDERARQAIEAADRNA